MSSWLTSGLGVERPLRGYRAYGLSVASELLLPELVPLEGKAGGGPADIHIRRQPLVPRPSVITGGLDYARPIADGVELSVDAIGVMQVLGGRDVIVGAAPGVTDQELRPLLLGPPFTLLLLQRGQLVLHASVVSIEGHAVAFVGDKGAGKSTLAAALQRQGHQLIADDMLSVDLTRDTLVAQPGFAHLKLWPDTVLALDQNPNDYPSLHPDIPKRMMRLRRGYATAALPLHSVCLLQVGPEPGLKARAPRTAVFDLLPHWSGARMSKDVLAHLGLGTQFQHCLAVASRVPVYALHRPLDFSRLDAVTDLVTGLVSG